MAHLVRTAVIIALVAVVAACSGLLPPQAIDDAFGLNGVVVTADGGGAPAALVVPAEAGGATTLTGSVASEVRGDDFPSIPGILNVTGISDVITIQATVGVSAAGDVTLAQAYTMTGASIALQISDGDDLLVDQAWTASNLDLTFSGNATYDPGTDTTSGSYTVSTQVPLVTLTLQGSALSAFVDALQEGTTLDVTGTMTVVIEPAFPSAASLTFTLQSLGGEISF